MERTALRANRRWVSNSKLIQYLTCGTYLLFCLRLILDWVSVEIDCMIFIWSTVVYVAEKFVCISILQTFKYYIDLIVYISDFFFLLLFHLGQAFE